MNTRPILLALLTSATLSLSAHAAEQPEIPVVVSAPGSAGYITVRQLAKETGLEQRQVRMVLGAHSGHAEYRVSFNRTQQQFRSALGEERYQDLMAGRPIPLYRQDGTGTTWRTMAAAPTP